MQYEILRPYTDVLLPMEDGRIPLHELFVLLSKDPESGRVYENFHWSCPMVLHATFPANPEWGAGYERIKRCVTLEYTSDYSLYDPGGDHDVTVWDDYGIATYWGYGGGVAYYPDGTSEEVKVDNDYYGAYRWLHDNGFIRLPDGSDKA